ncbi:MAG: Rpn family recombination-promoting nuclease/putative transposase [Bacillota bacterium]|nr:Rpn family recombination-promoting nuclease/putative transposase [Bacillota bacterium]
MHEITALRRKKYGKIFYQGKELLPPRQDLVFKAIFGTEDGKGLLAAFLRDVLGVDVEKAEDITLLNNEIPAGYELDKQVRLDLRVRTRNNEHINIEIQVADERNTIPRSVYYNAKLMASQEARGENYKSLGRALSLFILDFRLLPGEEAWYNS